MFKMWGIICSFILLTFLNLHTVTYTEINSPLTEINLLLETRKISLSHSSKTKKKSSSSTYPHNPFISAAAWKKIQPYFLPSSHPIKHKLDIMFSKNRITFSKESLEGSGFQRLPARSNQNIFVATHPGFPGYIFKIYTDTQVIIFNEWQYWLKRIKGALAINKCIKKHKYEHFFKVPQKWIYPLPFDPPPSSTEKNFNRKNFILIVEDMNILNRQLNRIAFRNNFFPRLLDALYIVVKEVGLGDSLISGNIPFNQKGRIVFVDTERHHETDIDYARLNPYLSEAMREYWQKLIDSGGP